MTILFLFGAGLLTIFLVIFLVFLFPLIALISILSNSFEGNDKLVWVVIVLLLPFLGAFLYFVIGINKRIGR